MRIATSARRILYILCAFSVSCTLLLSACSNSAATAKEGDTVKVLFVGTLADGTVFQSSEEFNNEPFQFTIGAEPPQAISGFEQAVIGMAVNETKKVHLAVDDAYGPYYDELVITLNRSEIQDGEVVEVGNTITLTNSYGDQRKSTVINVSEDSVIVDANHPLAGKDLNFEITLVEIVSAE